VDAGQRLLLLGLRRMSFRSYWLKIGRGAGSSNRDDGLQGHTFNLVGDVRLNAREYVECLRSFSGRRIAAFGYPIRLRFAATT